MKARYFLTIVLIGLFFSTACSPGIALGATEDADPVETVEDVDARALVVEVTEPQDNAQPQQDAEPENQDVQADSASEEETRPEGWNDGTHSKSADPNYEVVFPQDEVNRIDITIDPENWAAMMADMTELYGEFGAQPVGGQPPAGGSNQPETGTPPRAGVGERPQPPENGARPRGKIGPGAGGQPPGMGFGGLKEGDAYNPIWVTASVEFEGQIWQYVGIRFKGNSSLFSSWRSGNLKIPFKLDFDEFEDEYPEIDDQRFYGFKQLTLSSNFKDNALLREKVAADVFREAGVPSAHTAFYQVYVDYGEGPVYFGLYTLVEVIDDTVIEEQFSDDSGNLYKPSGPGASFAAGTFDVEAFDKETNQDEADWSDVQALYQLLHAELRTTDPAQWRTELESIFEVDGFLNWLAVNTVIQNWDTYGIMHHNYYLYHDPETGLLTWIPWDNNEAFQERRQRGNLSLSLDEVTTEWPLIRFLLDDPVYEGKYATYVEAVISGAFDPDEIKVKYQAYHDLISPYVIGPDGEIAGYTHLISDAAFENSVSQLIQHAYSRYRAAQEYLRSAE